jgi:hypothetical protein
MFIVYTFCTHIAASSQHKTFAVDAMHYRRTDVQKLLVRMDEGKAGKASI